MKTFHRLNLPFSFCFFRARQHKNETFFRSQMIRFNVYDTLKKLFVAGTRRKSPGRSLSSESERAWRMFSVLVL
jgi:hypothetical protein